MLSSLCLGYLVQAFTENQAFLPGAYLRSGSFFPSTLDPVKTVFLYVTLMVQYTGRTLWRKTLPLKPGFHTRKQWERWGKQNILGFVQWKRPLILPDNSRSMNSPLKEDLCPRPLRKHYPQTLLGFILPKALSVSLPVYVSVWIPGDWFWDNPTLLTLLLPIRLYYFLQSGPFHNGSSTCLFAFCER